MTAPPKYSIELFCVGGKGAGVERELAREDRLDAAWVAYRKAVAENPNRLVMLSVGARIIARSNR